ncbi:MAG: sodium-translocating pyrophosphatase [Chloroflexi bacterium]|nr:sodium-translocating pyrophosphatase [Chloroflexota bacterium]
MGLQYLVNTSVPLTAGFALMVVVILYLWLLRQDSGTERMREVAGFIQAGANTFLRREIITIVPFVVALALLLLIAMPKESNWQIALGFVVGAAFSMLSIFIGMNAATRANVRTTAAVRSSAARAMLVAFRGGGVMGLTIVALNLLGIFLLSLLFGVNEANPGHVHHLVGFGFGASFAALFAQLGGGIFTKGADIAADMVGKIEQGIPEDDPRNAAVIADQVGDNVGDVAGRGADLFESGSDNLIATMIVALTFVGAPFNYGWTVVLFPLLSRAIGAIGAVLGVLAVRGSEKRNPIVSMNIGFLVTALFSVASFYVLGVYVMHEIRLFYCLTLGLITAILVSLMVQFYTGINQRPVREIAEGGLSGVAINLIYGFAWGMESSVFMLVLVAATNVAAFYIMGGGLLGVLGITAATLGLTEMKGIIMAADAFGPIADNASGIAEMAGLGPQVRRAGDTLDAAGNIAKAITKGYGMSAALMTSVVVLFAYLLSAAELVGVHSQDLVSFVSFDGADPTGGALTIVRGLNLAHPLNLAALMIGVTVPFLFSSQAMKAVGRTAFRMVDEVRRQFREIPGLVAGEATPEYAKCVDIGTRHALKEMVAPTLVGVAFPIAVGFLMGPWALAFYLIGVKVIGAALAIFMFNAGGAWDNAKKCVEEGHFGGKGSEAHKAGVIGDTFGDPLKDTAGPSLHILIKLQNILSITLLPLFYVYGIKWH